MNDGFSDTCLFFFHAFSSSQREGNSCSYLTEGKGVKPIILRLHRPSLQVKPIILRVHRPSLQVKPIILPLHRLSLQVKPIILPLHRQSLQAYVCLHYLHIGYLISLAAPDRFQHQPIAIIKLHVYGPLHFYASLQVNHQYAVNIYRHDADALKGMHR